jgi:cytochrome P450
MVSAEEAGTSPFSSQELIAACIELLTAGHETTVNGIAKGIIGLLGQSD